LSRVLPHTGWGRHVVSIGLGPDLELCAALDATDAVPVMIAGRITRQ
jgi:phosphosulfolactate phosphohydrolase-like enzyme